MPLERVGLSLRAPRRRTGRGAEGLRRTLFDLEQDGYRVVWNPEVGRGVLDLILVGPSGVFAMAVTAERGALASRDEALTQAGADARGRVDQIRRAVRDVRHRFRESDIDLWVEGVLVATSAPVHGRRLAFPQVTVVHVADLGAFVREGRARLDDRRIGQASAAIRTRVPLPSVAPLERRPASTFAGSMALDPVETWGSETA